MWSKKSLRTEFWLGFILVRILKFLRFFGNWFYRLCMAMHGLKDESQKRNNFYDRNKPKLGLIRVRFFSKNLKQV